MSLLFKIIEYESKVFNDYLLQRQSFLEHLKKININNLDNTKLSILINNIKDIIDPIKTSTSNIDYYLKDHLSPKNDNLLFYLLLGTIGSESLLLNEVRSESDSSESDSDSE